MPSWPLHNQGLKKHVDLKKQPITAQRTLDLIKEEMKSYPSFSLLSYTQPFQLKCGVSEDGMSMILCTIYFYEFSIVPCHETTDIVLLMSSNDEKWTHSLLEHSNRSFTLEELESQMIDGKRLEKGNIFPF